jgi:oxygen-dependent protoporphyrinogen oxidase
MERRDGSLIRGARRQARQTRSSLKTESGARYGMFVSLAEGMGQLVDRLARSLPPGVLRTRTAVRRLGRVEPTGRWRVEPLNGPSLDVDAVLMAAEAHAAARLLDGCDAELAQALRSIPYASSAIAQLGFDRDQIRHPLDGFGAVVPLVEGRSILAVSFTSVKFPGRAPEGRVLMRVFLGGATQPHMLDEEDATLLGIATREVSELLGISGPPVLAELARHNRAMPQYTLGHAERIERVAMLASRHAGLALAGNYLDGVGIPDCVRAGQAAADRLMREVLSVIHPAAA